MKLYSINITQRMLCPIIYIAVTEMLFPEGSVSLEQTLMKLFS